MIIDTLKHIVSKKENDQIYFCFSRIRLLVLVYNCWTLKKAVLLKWLISWKLWTFKILLTITILEHCKWYLLDLTVQGPLAPPFQRWDPSGSDIWWPSLETCSNLFASGSPSSDIWRSSLEICSKLFTWGPFPWYWHLVATQAHTDSKRAVYVLLECVLGTRYNRSSFLKEGNNAAERPWIGGSTDTSAPCALIVKINCKNIFCRHCGFLEGWSFLPIWILNVYLLPGSV